MYLIKKYSNYLLNVLPIHNYTINKNEFFINISPQKLTSIITFLKLHTNCQYKILSDICVIDYPQYKKRFKIVYNLLSISYNSRICVKTSINELQSVDSISGIYNSAAWWEREIWDMFGIFFFDHPDLRRILTDYGFEGFPLRKDFPLSGFIEVRYDELKKRVTYEPLMLSQEYRLFNFESPWNLK